MEELISSESAEPKVQGKEKRENGKGKGSPTIPWPAYSESVSRMQYAAE